MMKEFWIELSKGMKALVDEDDFDRLNKHKWHATKNKNVHYAKRSEYKDGKQRLILMHREVLNVEIGEMIDHVNRDGLDNRKSNLRLCSHAQNRANGRTTNKTKFRGVCKIKRKLVTKDLISYEAAIRVNKKRIYIGKFKTAEEAAKAYDIAAIKHHGEFATLNFKRSNYE